MKIIRNEKELIGKTIAFVHMPIFSENITIATQDGCVLVVKQVFDEDTEDIQINIASEHMALRYIERSDDIREQLGALGIFDIETYRIKKEEERLIKQQEYNEKRLKEEFEYYQKLKAKFEKQEV